MKIKKVLINDMEKPFGFSFNDIKINSIFTECTTTDNYNITIMENNCEIYFSDNISSLQNSVNIKLDLKPRTRYFVVLNKNTDSEYTTWFETGKSNEPFTAKWIGGKVEVANNVFTKKFEVTNSVKQVRLYISAQGVYQIYINENIITDEVLAPGFTNYGVYTQIQTYDLTKQIQDNDNNLEISVGDGWYKGVLGFGDGTPNVYGDNQGIIAELHIEFENGSTQVINSDLDWQVYSGTTTASGIYYGQDLDLTSSKKVYYTPVLISGQPLVDRESLPIKYQEKFSVLEIVKNSKDEVIFDFGQNHSGVICFENSAKFGEKLVFEFTEILQDGFFYRENLREARARFEVISDGQTKWITPSFTFFGYRYVKVTGDIELNEKTIYSQSIYSDIEFKSSIKSDNKLVNQLFSNIIWGQKSNFIDVPTDCPQRNERLGWTGDANVFSKAALINANVAQFYRKYMKDVRAEQQALGGMVPMYAPAINHHDGGAAVWADVITMLPWNVYIQTGDLKILEENYLAMIDWITWVASTTASNENPLIWSNSFQFGDWLALDGNNPAIPSGGTDETFIATIYYYLSVNIVSKTAKLLNDSRYEEFNQLSEKIKQSILDEFVTTSGKMTLNTQTGFALMLDANILNYQQTKRVINDLVYRLNCDSNQIQTGFVGTPILLPALSQNNLHNLACKIFTNESYPGWLFAVKLGATTVWERWNSVLEDGAINPEGMNSLNHYSYGAVISWAYEYLLGIKNIEVGYKKVAINPGINPYIKSMDGKVSTPFGDISLNWKLADGKVKAILNVPLGVEAVIEPRGLKSSLLVNGTIQASDKVIVCNGEYILEYDVEIGLIEEKSLRMDSPLFDLANNQQVWAQMLAIKPQLGFFNDKSARGKFGNSSLQQVAKNLPFINFTTEELNEIKKILKKR